MKEVVLTVYDSNFVPLTVDCLNFSMPGKVKPGGNKALAT